MTGDESPERYRWERYTERARQVIVLAQEEARRLRQPAITTGDLILGLLLENEGLAAIALRAAGVELDPTRERVASLADLLDKPPTGQIPFTSGARQALLSAMRISEESGKSYLGTEHLLLGVLADEHDDAAQILRAGGTTLHQVREAVSRRDSRRPRGSRVNEARSVSFGGGLLPDGLREELEAAIEGSQPAWQSFAEYNREEPGMGGHSLALKYVDPQWAALYRQPNRGFMIGKSHHTWGDGVYVTGVQEPLSTAIYGRVGVVARFDPTDWRCFDAREAANRALYTSWLHAQPDYADAVLTVHNSHFLHRMRNDFREQFAIDVVLFGPDEVDSASAYTCSTDTWMAVSDWESGKLRKGYSNRFIDARVALLVEEEFRIADPGLSREALLRINGTPPPSGVVARQARAAYAAAEIARVES